MIVTRCQCGAEGRFEHAREAIGVGWTRLRGGRSGPAAVAWCCPRESSTAIRAVQESLGVEATREGPIREG